MAYRFNRTERLKSRKSIESLFASGKSVKSFPITMVYRLDADASEPYVKAAFTVSKRFFKRAVDRNRIKRLMRESYRLNKAALTAVHGKTAAGLNIIFIYSGKEMPEFTDIQGKIIHCLERLKL